MEGLTRHYQRNFVSFFLETHTLSMAKPLNLFGAIAHHYYIQGANYKFGVQVDSEGFAEAPPSVLFSVHRLDWVKSVSISQARGWALSNGQTYDGISEPVGDFNELLALGFMEDDSINASHSHFLAPYKANTASSFTMMERVSWARP
jgi:hypothetical protein